MKFTKGCIVEQFNRQEVKEFYEHVETVWPNNDKWHEVNQKEIKNYIHKQNCLSGNILNAGSGGNDYGLSVEMCHMDIVENKIADTPNHIIGSIEDIPLKDNSFDTIICVGSVINYCDALKAIGEMTRVLKKNGKLILEFENSYSFEFMNTKAHKARAAIISTSYFDKPHTMWVYSFDYISDILHANNVIIHDIYPFHILSSLSYYYNRNENKAAKLSFLDKMCRHIPIIKKYSGNVILYCEKI